MAMYKKSHYSIIKLSLVCNNIYITNTHKNYHYYSGKLSMLLMKTITVTVKETKYHCYEEKLLLFVDS